MKDHLNDFGYIGGADGTLSTSDQMAENCIYWGKGINGVGHSGLVEDSTRIVFQAMTDFDDDAGFTPYIYDSEDGKTWTKRVTGVPILGLKKGQVATLALPDSHHAYITVGAMGTVASGKVRAYVGVGEHDATLDKDYGMGGYSEED